MSFRLQCEVCGAKSRAVEAPQALGAAEREALLEFRAEHRATCGGGEEVAGASAASVPQGGPFGSTKAAPVSARVPHGHFEYTGPYGEIQEGDTLSCCHCRAHWEVRLGSGKLRGYCARCGAYTCGRAACDECVPYERRLENCEAGLPELTPAAPSVLVPALPRRLLGAGGQPISFEPEETADVGPVVGSDRRGP